MPVKKIPQRMCVSCRTRKNKKELIRIVHMPSGVTEVDPSGKKPGRGVYVCRSRVCIEQAVKANRIERGLKSEVSKETIDRLFQDALQYTIDEADKGE